MSSINIKFKSRDFSATKAGNSVAMKKIMEFGSAKKALKSASQQQAFYDTLKKNKDPNHMDKALKKTLGEFLENKKDKMTDKAVKAMGKEMVRYGKRFIIPKREMRSEVLNNKNGTGSIMARGMERRAQSLSSVPSSGQAPTPSVRIPVVGSYNLQNKMGNISPSFGKSSRISGTQPNLRTPFSFRGR